MNEQKAGQSAENEMLLDDGITIQELEQRTEMFYCCQSTNGGPSCGTN
ncbi:MAG: hypothetical protein ACYC9L_02950 [Sulfuricaulis sp.]